jgi:putative transposase
MGHRGTADPACQAEPTRRAPAAVDRREVLHTLCDLNRSGCQGALVPHDWRPKSPVYDDFAPWRHDGTWALLVKTWRERTRGAAGREPTPSAACIARQAVKTTELGGPERGDAGGKQSTGRQRPVWVDPLGLLLAVLMTRAGLDAGVAAPTLRAHVTPDDVPRLVTILAEQKYHHHTLNAWMAEHRTGWRIAVKTRPAGMQGFTPRATRWVVERTNAWHGRYCRNSKDDERRIASSTAMLHIRHRHLLLNRLSPCGRPVCHDRKDAA